MLNTFFGHTVGKIFKATGVGLQSPDGTDLSHAQMNAPTVVFHRWRDLFAVLINPELYFGEAFADGHITIKNGNIYDVMIRIMGEVDDDPIFILSKIWAKLCLPIFVLADGWSPRKSKDNVHAHYDLGNDLYQMFLDQDMQYSCAYFPNPEIGLDQAQANKKKHIINKLHIQSGMTCLDIGSGWGGLSFDLARAGGSVTGLTLSDEQYELARQRQKKNRLDVEFLLKDYRHEIRQFDRISSVGMFEHVGPAMFNQYFKQINRNLKDNGIALIHTIGRPGPPQRVNRFIAKYIFPGGYVPSLSQIAKSVEKNNLLITDVECLYLHYAETLRHWRIRFMERRQDAVKIYGERFARIWECYLAGSEVGFRKKQLTVFQIQIRKKNSPIDMTRDYIYDQKTSGMVNDDRAHG